MYHTKQKLQNGADLETGLCWLILANSYMLKHKESKHHTLRLSTLLCYRSLYMKGYSGFKMNQNMTNFIIYHI